ncbi:MAG TPA: TetR family transcriptional regulator [Marmoricola sp.]|nr:TetR family transcriptional regulator [Marmoricola sp.]
MASRAAQQVAPSPESGPRTARQRPYNASRRREAAALRRRHVFTVAGQIFAERGYTATTVVDVAEAAEVSPELIFKTMGGKPGLLLGAVRTAGTDPRFEDLRASLHGLDLPSLGSLEDRVDALVRLAVAAVERISPLVPALHVAADVDEQADRLLDALRREHLVTTRLLVDLLLADLPPDLSGDGQVRSASRSPLGARRRARAAEELYVLTSAETHHQFVQVVGWTRRRYAAWLRHALLDGLRRAVEPVG